MFGRSFTTLSPVRTSVTRYGGSTTVLSPLRHVSSTVHHNSIYDSHPMRTSVTHVSPMRASITTTTGTMERARPVVDLHGLTRCVDVVRGALPNSYSYGTPVQINDTGYTSYVKPTDITRLPAPIPQEHTYIRNSPIRASMPYVEPLQSHITNQSNYCPTTATTTSTIDPYYARTLSPARISSTVTTGRHFNTNFAAGGYVPNQTTTVE